MKLTPPQRKLLAELPEAPSDGKRCKAARLVTATNLARLKLARVVGANQHISGLYFVRTKAGTEVLRTIDGVNPFPQLSDTPCPRCLALVHEGGLRVEAVQRLPEGLGVAPVARDGSGKCCFDCASADAVMQVIGGMDFPMARIAVGNDRQEQYRLPGAPMGLVQQGLMRPSAPGDLEKQHAWLNRHNWFDVESEGE